MEHKNEGYDCPCGPVLLIPCNQCDGEGCWECGFATTDGSGVMHGLVEVGPIEADEAPYVIVVHR